MSTRRIQGMSLLMNLSVPGEGAADTCKWDMQIRANVLGCRTLPVLKQEGIDLSCDI